MTEFSDRSRGGRSVSLGRTSSGGSVAATSSARPGSSYVTSTWSPSKSSEVLGGCIRAERRAGRGPRRAWLRPVRAGNSDSPLHSPASREIDQPGSASADKRRLRMFDVAPVDLVFARAREPSK